MHVWGKVWGLHYTVWRTIITAPPYMWPHMAASHPHIYGPYGESIPIGQMSCVAVPDDLATIGAESCGQHGRLWRGLCARFSLLLVLLSLRRLTRFGEAGRSRALAGASSRPSARSGCSGRGPKGSVARRARSPSGRGESMTKDRSSETTSALQIPCLGRWL